MFVHVAEHVGQIEEKSQPQFQGDCAGSGATANHDVASSSYSAAFEHVAGFINPLKVCHTKIDRMRSMGVCSLNSVVCRRMATKLPRKLPNAFLHAKLKSFHGVHIQLLAEIGG